MLKSTKLCITNSYMDLSDCINLNNIENNGYILDKIAELEKYKYSLPIELRKDIEKFIEEVINPIIYDLDYFDFLHKAEYGEYNSDGHFIISSDRSLEMMIFELYNHTIELHEKLLKVFAKYIK